MDNKRMRAFDLPKMKIENRFDYDKDEILKELMDAPVILTSYRTKEGESRFLFTDLGEEEFKLFVSQVNRLIPLYDFVKCAIQNIDYARGGEIEQQRHLIEAIKFLKLKNLSL